MGEQGETAKSGGDCSCLSTCTACCVGGRVFALILRRFDSMRSRQQQRVRFSFSVKDTEWQRRFPCIECDSESMRLLPTRNYPVASDQGGSCWMLFNIQSQISDQSVCHTNQHLPAAKHVSKLKIKKDNSRVINILPG